MTIYRTSRDGCWQVVSNSWGEYLAPAIDPLADTVISEEQFKGFELNPDLPKIPAALWRRWILLCYEMTRKDNRNLEVSCRLLRNEADPTKYRILVPVQEVSGASVRVESFDKAIDIETGEVVAQWPPEGWRPCGSSHSHNTMDAFFSGTDDKYELGDPGVHIVVGRIEPNEDKHVLKCSITARKQRFIVEAEDLLELAPVPNVSFHEAALAAVTVEQYGVPKGVIWPKHTVSTNPYSSGFTPNYSYKKENVNTAAVAGELEDVMAALDALQLACDKNGLPASDVLRELSWEIDDMSYAAGAGISSLPEDPFYWSSV